jgi:hypothetical protein
MSFQRLPSCSGQRIALPSDHDRDGSIRWFARRERRWLARSHSIAGCFTQRVRAWTCVSRAELGRAHRAMTLSLLRKTEKNSSPGPGSISILLRANAGGLATTSNRLSRPRLSISGVRLCAYWFALVPLP